jgi:superfamily II DNA or RNA helicase
VPGSYCRRDNDPASTSVTTRAQEPSGAPTLFDYQVDFIADFACALKTARRVLGVLPTGGGKTVIMSEITRRFVGRRVLVLAHRREIVGQTSRHLFKHDVSHGIIQAGFPLRPQERVQVASIQTLHARGIRGERMELPPADLVVVDEAHHATADTYKAIIEAYPEAILLGLTATPCRGDGRGLGGIFEVMIEGPQVAELIELGRLVKTRVYAPTDPDLRGVHTRHGDYVENELADRMDRPELVGDTVENWHKHSERRKTVVFAINVPHSRHICEEFKKSGVRAEHIDGSTPKDMRDATLARLASGETEVVSNCMVLTEGFDCPDIGCIVLARPTKKMGLFRQMVGRGLRAAPGKTDLILIDHSGATYQHGLVEDPVEWTLDPEQHAKNKKHESRGKSDKSRLLECIQCGAIRVAGEACPCCGFLPQAPAKAVPIIDGELELVQGGRAQKKIYTHDEKMRWLGMLTSIQLERGYKPGWPAANFKEKFGHWPAYGLSVDPITPSPECRSWVRSRMIAYVKRRGAA